MSRPPLNALSAAQRRIARMMARFEKQERPPFVSDLVKALGLAAESSLTPTLRVMKRNRFIEILGGGAQGRSRLVRLTARGRLALGIGGLPLLGSIPAGPLREALAEPEEIIEPHQVLPARPNDFLLRVRGDSMTGDGIFEGDLVLLRPEVAVEPGEIAAVCVGDAHEGTLKRVFPEGAQVRLKAGNPEYADILVPASEVKVAGVFRGLIRHATLRH
jgi:repressor LexA